MKKLYLAIFVILLAVSAGAVLMQDYGAIDIKTTKVAGSVYLLTGASDATTFSGGNIGISVGEDGVLMVDSKFAPMAPKIKKAIEAVGGSSPKFILNTHVHGDHTNGNSEFSSEGTVIAHTNIRKRLVGDEPAELWPVITFDQSLSVHFNGEEIEALHYPEGHTDGDGVIYFMGSNVVHMGDLYFSGMFPFIDLNSGGTVQGYVAAVRKMASELPAGVKIIPGHGPLSTLADLKTNLRMLEETTKLVTQKMKAGRSLEQIKQEGLPDEWKSWNWNFITTDRWIETIHNGYSK